MSPDEVEDDVLVGGAKDSEVVNVTAQGDSARRAQLLAAPTPRRRPTSPRPTTAPRPRASWPA